MDTTNNTTSQNKEEEKKRKEKKEKREKIITKLLMWGLFSFIALFLCIKFSDKWIFFLMPLQISLETNQLIFKSSEQWILICILLIILILLGGHYLKNRSKNKSTNEFTTGLYLLMAIFDGVYLFNIISAKAYWEYFDGIIKYATPIILILTELFLILLLYKKWHNWNHALNYYDKPESDKKSTSSKALPDEAIKKKDDDLLNYQIVAQEDANTIDKLSLESSWSIGITAPWGEGKTSYINLIIEELTKKKLEKTPSSDTNEETSTNQPSSNNKLTEEKRKETPSSDTNEETSTNQPSSNNKNEKYIIVKFNPRNSKSKDEIQEDFFHTLCDSLKDYIPNISNMVKDYLNALQLVDREYIAAAIQSLKKILTPKSEKENISDALKKLPQKVLVAIDDFDRLMADEIIEVLKIIDINGDFPNIIYLSAYDKDYLSSILSDTYKSPRSNFADKFFNLELNVPIRPYRMKLEILVNKMEKEAEVTVADMNKMRHNLAKYSNYLEKYVPTVRDVKRFYNILINDYTLQKDRVNLDELILVTILKYRSSDIYTQLYYKKWLTLDNGIYTFKGTKNRNYGKVETDKEYMDIIKELFYNQWKDIKEIPLKSIQREESFNEYFTNGVYHVLKLKEMKEVFRQDYKIAKREIAQWIDEDKIDDFIEYLRFKDPQTLRNKEEFEAYVKKVIYTVIKVPMCTLYEDVICRKLIVKEYATEYVKRYHFGDLFCYREYIADLLTEHYKSDSIIAMKLEYDMKMGKFKDKEIILKPEDLKQRPR